MKIKHNPDEILSKNQNFEWNLVESYTFSSVVLDVNWFNVRFHESEKIFDSHLQCS